MPVLFGAQKRFFLKVLCFYYVGNIVENLQGRYDRITRKPTDGCAIVEGDFLIMKEILS